MSMHPTINYFKQYKGNCDVFIETGTNQGGGVTLAVLASFTEIYTIDIKHQLDPAYKHGLKNIHYLIGDSAEVLSALLPKLSSKKPMMWLDAHSDLINQEDNFPLIRELDVISEYYHDKMEEWVKQKEVVFPTILIDDYLYMSHPLITGWTHKQIEKKIKEINHDYKIEYLPNPIKNNILIAYL